MQAAVAKYVGPDVKLQGVCVCVCVFTGAIGSGLKPQFCHFQVLISWSRNFLLCMMGCTSPKNTVLVGTW